MNTNEMKNLIEAGSKIGGRKTDWRGNVIIFPGGGYEWHSPREAQPVAEAFAAAGWRPWLLYYQVSHGEKVLGTEPLRQAAQAVAQVRAKYPGQIVVVCGFSAGGHAAASLGVHWDDEQIFKEDDQKRVRPDAIILGYPVITAGIYAHEGSIDMLVGKMPESSKETEDQWQERRNYFSLEKFVNAQTPPTFIWHTAGDSTVMVQNSLLFAESLAANRVPFELHIYPRGEHGLSLATKEVEEPEKGRFADAHVAGWFAECMGWLDMLKKE